MSHYKIQAATGQHIGTRPEQQDRLGLFASSKVAGYVMAVIADGMGGRSGGAVAAEQLLSTAAQLFESFSPPMDSIEDIIQSIAAETQLILHLNKMAGDIDPHTTMVLLVLTPEGEAIWGHVGDSRLYRFSGPNFAERTIDHTCGEALAQSGAVSRAEASRHKSAGMLVNAIGAGRDVPPTASISRYAPLAAGDAFLLCSDGLWQYFTEDEMGAVISVKHPRHAAAMLMNKAESRASGHQADNRSLIIVKIVEADDEPSVVSATPAGRLRQRSA